MPQRAVGGGIETNLELNVSISKDLKSPAPDGWTPKIGDPVVYQPGWSGRVVDIFGDIVRVESGHGGKKRRAEVLIRDVRPAGNSRKRRAKANSTESDDAT